MNLDIFRTQITEDLELIRALKEYNSEQYNILQSIFAS